MPQVRIPTPLRSLTDGQNTVDIEATTVGALVKNLDAAHPGFAERLLDEEGDQAGKQSKTLRPGPPRKGRHGVWLIIYRKS